MKTRLSQVGLVAGVVLGSLVVCCPVATQGATLFVYSDPDGMFTKVCRYFPTEHYEQLKPIFRDEAQKLKNLRAQTGLSRWQKHAQLNQIRQDLLVRITPVLTPEQLQKWQELRGQNRSRRHTASQP